MADLIDTTEMYLRTILELEEEGIVPLRARISERLNHSGPTVSQTVGRMERDGLVVVTDDRRLELTPEGRTKSVNVMRKHRLAERLLADVIGLEWEYVHEEACRWEHVMSERVERKLLSILDHPTESPYGNPIPGLEDLGSRVAGSFQSEVVGIGELLVDPERTVTARIRRLAEPAQVDPELLSQLATAGVKPGNTAAFMKRGDFVHIEAEGYPEAIELPTEIAAHIFVSP
ncbi:metal-dependent transcriptional regulator [Leucobacter insecticola]|uniref:Metal-dependent transcriptional regulator n=1 Tax=Leucobacter insecticola TaxID=2714934 RepID=A0A6G8FFV2_9MICO|nr:metal-dependent transcriptional regulator [Leucobacter insecticola]QIM15228.1 metal-dependent transcriptional regulator [Leucobacter insecticola]